MCSCLSGSLQLPLIPPTHLLKSISILPFPIQQHIHTGEFSFPLPHLLSIHTHLSTVFSPSLPLTPPISFSLSLSLSSLLCVFCFGAVIFRLISEVMHFLQIKEEARLHPPPPPHLPPSSTSFPPSLHSLLFSPPSAPQAREEIKEPPSFPC